MFLGKRHLLFACVVCAILHLASLASRRIVPAHPGVAFSAEGSFTEGGWYPGEKFAQAEGVRAWGSWSGGDENTGAFTLGPFPAPRILRFGAGGYPNDPANSLEVALVGTGQKLPIKWSAVGERWAVVDFPLPAAWEGKPIRLLGADQAKGLGGWFAITEPIRGGRGDGNNALLESLAAFAINGVLLGLIYFAALRWLLARDVLVRHWIPLGAAAIVAVFGYVAFWIYFLNSLAGVVFSWAAILGSAAYTLRRSSDRAVHDADATLETAAVLKLMALIGCFYLGVLHLFPSPHDFYTLAANRFREALPSDNMLPHGFAERLFTAQPPKNPADEWQSSDRPPLQAGWVLLTWPAAKLLDLDRRCSSGTSAMWFQLLWVAGVYGLLRTFRVERLRACGWVAACALAGFFLQNTTFTWPKLSAGAFACGAFAVLLLPRGTTTSRANGFWSATFAGLAWLSHGGVAFSFLPLVPVVLWRAARGEWRAWLPGAAACFLLLLPWVSYQKFYDPPGNMLLKLHLAGLPKQDTRGLWEVISDSYRKASGKEIWANKVSNFHAQVYGHWPYLGNVAEQSKADRRNQEFFHAGRALTWWPLAALAAVAVRRRRLLSPGRDLAILATWLVATVVVWCLLMFGKYQAVVHHGSYALMLGWFVLFSVVLDRGGGAWLALVAALQVFTFTTNWATSNAVVNGPTTGLFFVLATGAGLAAFILRAVFRGQTLPEEKPAPATSWLGRNLDAARAWWGNPRLTWVVLAALAALLALRKPHALHTAQLWAEDGSIFLMQADLHGNAALAMPYMGYLHTLPRLIAWFAPKLLDPAWWPTFYNAVSFALWIWILGRFFSSRFDLPGKPWLVLAFFLGPNTGEVLFNITNLQWLLAFALLQQVLIAPPVNWRERIGDLTLLVLVTLTGPFGVIFAPLFLWRWWRDRSRDNLAALFAVGLCAALQAWIVVRTAPKFDYQSAPFEFFKALAVLARRILVWPVLGDDLAHAAPLWLLILGGGGFIVALLLWALRPDPLRRVRGPMVAAFVLILLASVYRTRPDTWAADNLLFGDRYFYIPRVLLAWLLIWEFHALPRFVAVIARLACLSALVVHLDRYVLPAPPDLHWADRVQPIRDGVRADIPTLPEGWTLEYRGRPPTP